MYKADDKRYDSMIYNRCGDSGLKLPAMSLGLWHNFGDDSDFSNMVSLCETAFDNGITHFDLANNYGPEPGAAEVNFGKILKEGLGQYRDELIISTKAGYTMWPGPYGDHGSKKYLVASLDQSLKRMGLDYVDIFYHHRPDPETPIEETCRALDLIVRQGKALYVGISNYNKEQTEAAKKWFTKLGTPFVINQVKYNMLERMIERNGLKDFAAPNGVGLIAFCPLAQGMLSGKYLNGIPSDSRIAKGGRYIREADVANEDTVRKIQGLNEIARNRNQSLAQMALSWVLRDNDVTSVLIGASKTSQILENLEALKNTQFSQEEREAIDKLSR